MRILLAAATSFEIAPLLNVLDEEAKKRSFFEYIYNGHTVLPLVTGVGSVMMTYAISRFQGTENIDLAINVGIAGSFKEELLPGSLVEVTHERFGDLGVEERDGSFTDVHEMELLSGARFPFNEGWIENKKPGTDLEKVKSITVNKVHGAAQSIDRIKEKYDADIENMEGAAFAYVCSALDIDYLQVRSISNMVEPRNRDNWKIDESIEKLNNWLKEYLNQL